MIQYRKVASLYFQAGYSPIMLAALAGFESKTDKYVMQRLIRAGDINAKNKEVVLNFVSLSIPISLGLHRFL